MLRRRFGAALLALALFVMPPAAASARADDGADTSDTWIGAVSAGLCGVFVRATIATAGTQAGTWAGALATCGFALLDALFLDDQKSN